MQKLSVAIITMNEERNIVSCVGSVKPYADEIVVVDSRSADRTVELARELGCRVFPRDWEGFARQKQYAVDQCSNDWVLVLDADEVISPELGKELRQLMDGDPPPFNGYEIHRTLVYLGRELKFSGEGHYTVLRLFDQRKGRFNDAAVHEKIETEGPVGKLRHKMVHYSYCDLHHHLEKLNSYTTLAAEEYIARGKRVSVVKAAGKFPVSFFIYYFLRLGILDGFPGFVWSFMAAFHGTLKLAKTIEMKRLGRQPRS